MTEDEKHNLLRKDLCARFPYYVKLKVKYEDGPWTLFVMHQSEKIYVLGVGGYPIEVKLTDCQPYLRPMSSMTEEEKRELEHISEEYFGKALDKQFQESLSSNINEGEVLEYIASSVIVDWLNSRHFDYRGLIEQGLAIEAPEGMYKFNK